MKFNIRYDLDGNNDNDFKWSGKLKDFMSMPGDLLKSFIGSYISWDPHRLLGINRVDPVIVYSIVNSPMGLLSLTYVAMYALGKGIGTYTSLTLWDKWFPKKISKPKCGL